MYVICHIRNKYIHEWPLDRVLYSSERLASIATEAAKGDAVFTFKDRIGLVHDAFALARAGFADMSTALTLVDILKDEKECESCMTGSFFSGLLTIVLLIL